MFTVTKILLGLTLLTLIAGATTAHADFCIQLSQNGVAMGALGFFRFKGTRPVASGAMVPLIGRVAGLSPAWGSAVVPKGAGYAEYGVTFFADAGEGQFDITFSPAKSPTGDGYWGYGEYNVSQSVTAAVVSCRGEPVASVEHGR